MPNSDSHQHVVKTTSQWEERAVEYWVVPRGCLCVELTPEGKTKLKVGEGDKYFKQLPYICDHEDLSDYYTKEEIDNLFDTLNRMAIVSTEEYDSKDELPLIGNKLGDIRFVKSSEPGNDPDVYLWNGTKWINTGSDVDMSNFVTKAEFNEVKDKVDEIYPKAHTHANKDILDSITQADRDKFDDLHNYDDTEIRELIAETGHTHPNKEILDTITQQSILNPTDREKFDSLHNYDDTDVQNRLEVVESKAHTHDNKTVLDNITQEKMDAIDALAESYVVIKIDIVDLKSKSHTHDNYYILADTTASYTIDQQNELIRLSQIGTFIGAGPDWDGVSGYVPAPSSGEEGYFLRGDGTWANVTGSMYYAGNGIEFTGTSEDTINAKLGNGLQFDANGAIEIVNSQYVRVSTTDNFLLLHTKPADWDTDWDRYYELTYDQIPGVPPYWDPTKHYKYENDSYVLGSPGDTFVSTTWYDKHYVGLDPSTPVVFDSDVYYTGDLALIEDGEDFDTAFEKMNEAIQHIGRLECEVEFLKDDKVGVRTTVDPERIEFYKR